jgi:hypothetical protein
MHRVISGGPPVRQLEAEKSDHIVREWRAPAGGGYRFTITWFTRHIPFRRLDQAAQRLSQGDFKSERALEQAPQAIRQNAFEYADGLEVVSIANSALNMSECRAEKAIALGTKRAAIAS